MHSGGHMEDTTIHIWGNKLMLCEILYLHTMSLLFIRQKQTFERVQLKTYYLIVYFNSKRFLILLIIKTKLNCSVRFYYLNLT
jgi:hypothetical protein